MWSLRDQSPPAVKTIGDSETTSRQIRQARLMNRAVSVFRAPVLQVAMPLQEQMVLHLYNMNQS